jgi:hypothetical protein
MVYECKICNTTFVDLSKYNRHLSKKTTCDPVKREQNNIDKLTCQKCKKVLSSTTRLKSHTEICKVDLTKQEKLEQMIENLTKQNEILNEKMDKLMNKETKTININNTVNQQQNNIFNIVPYGKEKFDYITKKEYNKIFAQGFRCLQMLIPLIYCNEQNPENMNVYISNFNDDKIRIFDGKNWIIEKKDYILTNMYNSKRDFLELKYEDMYDELTDNAKYYFERFKDGNTDQETIEPILDELKNILYSNRNNVVKKPVKICKKIATIKDFEEEQINDTNEKKNITNDPDYIPNKSMFF